MGSGNSKPKEMEQVTPRETRSHPQERFDQTVIENDSFFGKLRTLYSDKVLQTQLEQLRKQGSYGHFSLQWNPKYDIARVKGGKCSLDGSPPALFWDSDVAKWCVNSDLADDRIEAACYFLASPAGTKHSEYERAIDELVSTIVKAQQPDGYLGTYFTVVDRAGRLKNLRDMHEMYCCGHLIEAALAHHHHTGNRKFLNAMIGVSANAIELMQYVDLLMKTFGPQKHQRHGYGGHPELELAVLRLYSVTKDPRHYAFGKYLLEARGRREVDLGNKAFFVWEAEQRKDPIFRASMDSIDDGRYHQWHAPLQQQEAILGHSVRALYLLTGAADMDGALLEDAKRLWYDCVDNKMYPTGGIGSIPAIEGFSEIPHFLPNAHDEGGCYAETCASIACMMVTERILSHGYDQKARDVLERCLLNNVLGGASLDGKQFYYANRLATSAGEVSDRDDWFDVCCCPPNLTRTMGMLGGYVWNTKVAKKVIQLDVYLFASATTTIPLSSGVAHVRMETEMPWKGKTTIEMDAPAGYTWNVNVPRPDYAANYNCSQTASRVTITFDMPVRLLSPHPATHQDTLVVQRGPIVYAAESHDNEKLNQEYPHFANVGMLASTTFDEVDMSIEGIPMVGLVSKDNVYGLRSGKTVSWSKLDHRIRLVPFFARANRSTGQTLRTQLRRVAESDIDDEAPEDAKLRGIYEEEWTWRKAQRLEDDEDEHSNEHHLPRVGKDAQLERLAYWETILNRVDDINFERLSRDAKVNHGVYRAQIEVFVNQIRFRDYEKPLNADSAFWSNLSGEPKDLQAFLSQLRDVPRYFGEQMENMRAGVERGFTPPKVTLVGRDLSIASVANAKAEDTTFFKHFRGTHMHDDALSVIQEDVIPSYKKLLRFFREDYFPRVRETLAAYDLPNGEAYYAAKICEFTTVDLSPEEIHNIGLREVENLTSRMKETKVEAKFSGTLAEFLHFLRTDPQFYATTPEQLLKEAAWIAKEFDAVSGDFFGLLPRQRFAIKPVPDELAPYYTSGRGGPGVYFVNTYDLKSRALYSLPALTLHESAPGHAFQMPLALEHDLPPFRSKYISAYGEGWALYCEHLGTEMGIYHTPYDTFGMLSYQAWRAARLVVDTGVHAKGWSRKQAQDYLAEHTALSEHEIETEVDRYIAWPAQALSYYLGQLEIIKLRRRAEERLGDRFNVKGFHDAVLQTGSVPLPILEGHIERYIEAAPSICSN